MSQVYSLPMLASDTLSASRTVINDAIDATRTNFLGTIDPTTLVDGMIWINSSTNKIKSRKSGSTIALGDWSADMGHVRRDGTTPMTANWNLGGFRITNLGPDGSPAVTNTQLETKFNPDASGHDHSGTSGNGPFIDASNVLNLTDLTFLTTGDSEVIALATLGGSTGGWVRTTAVSAHVHTGTAKFALIQCEQWNTAGVVSDYIITWNFRDNDPGTTQPFFVTHGHPSIGLTHLSTFVWVRLDSGEEFEYQINVTGGDTRINWALTLFGLII